MQRAIERCNSYNRHCNNCSAAYQTTVEPRACKCAHCGFTIKVVLA